MKAARGGRTMQGLAHFLSCFKFIHRWGKRKTEGGRGLALSFIFCVGGWNNINISFSLKLYKSNSYYYSNSTGSTQTHHIWNYSSFFFVTHIVPHMWLSGPGQRLHIKYCKGLSLYSAVISPKQVLWLASAVSSILTLGRKSTPCTDPLGTTHGTGSMDRA